MRLMSLIWWPEPLRTKEAEEVSTAAFRKEAARAVAAIDTCSAAPPPRPLETGLRERLASAGVPLIAAR
jgi:hypothetical protein